MLVHAESCIFGHAKHMSIVRYIELDVHVSFVFFPYLFKILFYETLQLPNETGCSPIELAKAYMAMRTSEVNLGSKCAIPKDERPTVLSDNFESESFVPLPSPMSSSCWLGSMVQNQCGCLTPHSRRDRFGLHNIPRTPYFRTLYSKSKLKVWNFKILH